jgi:hypothetical protein
VRAGPVATLHRGWSPTLDQERPTTVAIEQPEPLPPMLVERVLVRPALDHLPRREGDLVLATSMPILMIEVATRVVARSILRRINGAR